MLNKSERWVQFFAINSEYFCLTITIIVQEMTTMSVRQFSSLIILLMLFLYIN